MLESRNCYGYTGIGITGENMPEDLGVPTRMPYWKYKQKFSDHRTVSGSYRKADKTIEVYIPESEIKPSGMRGQTVNFYPFWFSVDGKHFMTMYKAVSKENAKRRFAKDCKKYNWNPEERTETYTEYDQYAMLIPKDIYANVFKYCKPTNYCQS